MTYPPTGGAPAPPRRPPRPVDMVATILALLMLLAGAAVLGFFSLFTVMATDSCGTGVSVEPAVCDTDYMGAILFGYWAALFVVPTVALVASVIALARRRLAWPYAAAGLLGLVVVTVVYGVLLTR